ncbi:MAG: sugar ABC transporter permease [Anaerolineae bacterium]
MAVGAKMVVSAGERQAGVSFGERLRREWYEHRTAYLLLVPSMLSFVILVIFPLASTVAGAFASTDAVGRITDFGTLANFRGLLDDPYMPAIIRQTFLFTFGSVVLTVVISFPLALILNQKFPGASVARALLLLPWAAPLAISSMTWRWIFHGQLGALNHLLHLLNLTQQNIDWLSNPRLAFACVIFVEVWSSIPFMTITFLAGLQAIPPHIYDAAKMDGASPWDEFWTMTVPQMKVVFTIVTLLSVIWAFRSFIVIWTMTQGNPFYRTDISVTYLYKLAFKRLTFGQGFALAFATFIVLLVFSVIYTRVLRSEELG